MSDTKFKLSKALQTHSGEVSELTLKEPTARLFVAHGEPFKIRVITNADESQNVEYDFDNAKMVKFLAGMVEPKVDDLIIGGLRASDYLSLRMRAAEVIIGITGTDPTQPSAA
ncbi:MAG: hypothetical protein B7Y77_01880 [Bradyrhizobium sp. 35-63-5]|nr:MAG: hypothetical protein B7Y77_01880 [Bradyrhizobium sp. 35-63-5]